VAGNLVHFELGAKDTSRAKQFWSSLFGWSFGDSSGPVEYHMTDAGGAPGGAIYRSQSDERGPIVYFDVDDLDATLDRVRHLGGAVELGKSPIPGVGWFARCTDTEGNRFSLFQSEPSVPAPGETNSA
jgi:predicted enzyme related to lactoylglutathione lyase